MKKIFTILCLMALTLGAQAGVVTDRASAGSPMTFAEFQALAGTGKHFAIVGASDNTQFCYPNWFGFTANFAETLSADYLFDLEGSGPYTIKRVSDDKYVSGEGGQFAATTSYTFYLVNRTPADYASEFTSDMFISLDNAASGGNHYNLNPVNLGFRVGTGGYSAYVAYGPFYVVTVNCVEEGNESNVLKTEKIVVTDGTEYEYTPAEITGYDVVTGQNTSVTVNSADATLNVAYKPAAIAYNVVLVDMPEGTTVSIGGTVVNNGDTYNAEGTLPDVSVSYPAILSHEKFFTTIEGTTITISRGTLFSIAASTGTFYSGNTKQDITSNNKFVNKWISTATSPSLTLSCRANNIIINSTYLTDTKFNLHVDPANYSLTPQAGYEVKSYSITGYAGNGSSSINGEVVGTNAENATTVTGTTLPIVIAGTANPWMYITEFKVLVQAVPSARVTYVIKENGETIYTSDPVVTKVGETITELPAELQQTLFYDYTLSPASVEVTEDMTIEVTATRKDSAPFKFTADATSPVWYGLTLSATPNYVTYTEGGAQNVTLPTTNADNETTHWAFIGNPHAGFTIVNEAAGTSLVLGSAATTGSASDGGNVYATLAAAGSQTNELWTVHASTAISNGFFLQNTEGHRLNKRNGTANVSYWTGGSDAGSTFVATKVPGLDELIPEAETLLSELTAGANDVQIGYPTADALSTFSSAINDAKDILNNGGDEATAIAALKAAMKAVKAIENINYTPRTDVYYTITSGRGSMVYDASHSSQTDSKYGNEFLWYSTNLDKTNANHQWGFIEVEGKYYMYNVGKKQFANVTQGGSYQGGNGDKHTWMFSNSPSSVTLDAGEGNWVAAPNVRVRATSEVTGKQYAMSISTSYVGPVIAYDAVNDGGIPMTFAIATTEQDSEVTTAIEALLNDPTPYKEALQEAINEANTFLTNLANYPIGEGLNQYTMTGDTDALSSAVAAGGTELEKADATKESLQAAIQAINDAKESISLSLNMPKANTFLRIKSAATEKYISSTVDGSQSGKYATYYLGVENADNTAIWFYDGTHLLNYATGLYTNNCSAADLGATGTEFAFSEAPGVLGKYNIKPGSQNYWYAGNPTIDNYSDNTHANTRFTLEYVDELPVTMNDGLDGKYYATFSAPVAISSITGATAHKVKVENEKAKYSETGVEGIPAGTGVLLINETGDNAMLTIGDFTDAIDTDLRPITAAVSSHEGLFFGLSTENKLGFFKLMEGGETAAPTTGGFKAYLDGAVTPTGAKGVELVADNEATGVEAIDHSEFAIDNAPVYNLQGQRVNKAQKGVFIQNGKKVVVR